MSRPRATSWAFTVSFRRALTRPSTDAASRGRTRRPPDGHRRGRTGSPVGFPDVDCPNRECDGTDCRPYPSRPAGARRSPRREARRVHRTTSRLRPSGMDRYRPGTARNERESSRSQRIPNCHAFVVRRPGGIGAHAGNSSQQHTRRNRRRPTSGCRGRRVTRGGRRRCRLRRGHRHRSERPQGVESSRGWP